LFKRCQKTVQNSSKPSNNVTTLQNLPKNPFQTSIHLTPPIPAPSPSHFSPLSSPTRMQQVTKNSPEPNKDLRARRAPINIYLKLKLLLFTFLLSRDFSAVFIMECDTMQHEKMMQVIYRLTKGPCPKKINEISAATVASLAISKMKLYC
jgi:hypothetical protein